MRLKVLKQLRNVISNKIKDFRQDRHFKKQARRTLTLRKAKATDLERWGREQELYPDWDERTKILAGYIQPGARVVEFGAGNMALKAFLPKNCSYTPTDIYLRSEEFLQCDLNKKIELDLTGYDTAIISGVLEYVYDVEKVFKQIEPSIEYVILSYDCSDISNANRLKRGWLSDYTKTDLQAIFTNNNYEIVDEQEWRNQSIFFLKRSNI